MLRFLLLFVVALNVARAAAPPRQIFAHYMGCFPVGRGALPWYRGKADTERHDSGDFLAALGGRFRTWPLVPYGPDLSPAASATLEIKRATRIGVDGFAVDAWAGGDGAKATLDALFAAAETMGADFQLTICLDRSCHKFADGDRSTAAVVAAFADSIRWLLDHHGDSPNLARRDGKPLIFGYSSRITPRLKGPEDEENWPEVIAAYREIEQQVGVPLYFHFGIEHFFVGCDLGKWPGSRPPHQPGEPMVRATALMATHFGAVGAFLDTNYYPELPAMAAAAHAAGAEWSQPVWHQYQNLGGSLHVAPGLDILQDRWRLARELDSTLIQYVTWNDYGEATNLAPDQMARYSVHDVNGYFIRWWKTGTPPVTDHDRVYLIYRAHAQDAPVFPFHGRRPTPGALEVVTWLTAPAEVRLPGRPEQWPAPAGFSSRQVPLQPGPVSAELVRAGAVVLTLTSPDPVSALPFREDSTVLAWSTEYERLWREDFGDAPSATFSLYGDADGDGLPNWFEMYWFGKFLDWTTATVADPRADPDGDGRANLQEYLAQSDPTRPEPVYGPGHTWDIEDVPRRGTSFNPDADREGTRVWHYLYRIGNAPIPHDDFLPCPHSAPKTGYTGAFVHSAPYRAEGYANVYAWIDRLPRGEAPEDGWRLRFLPRPNSLIALAWESPVAGTVKLRAVLDPEQTAAGARITVEQGAAVLAEKMIDPETTDWTIEVPPVAVKTGDRLRVVVDQRQAVVDVLTIELLKP